MINLPVRIPIRKGILGYRIFLIRKQVREKFAKITTLDELKQLMGVFPTITLHGYMPMKRRLI